MLSIANSFFDEKSLIEGTTFAAKILWFSSIRKYGAPILTRIYAVISNFYWRIGCNIDYFRGSPIFTSDFVWMNQDSSLCYCQF